MRNFRPFLAGLALLAAGAAHGASAELVVNGDFNQLLAGWTQSGYSDAQWVATDTSDLPGADNTNHIFTDGAFGSYSTGGFRYGKLSQILNTVAGQAYTLSFSFASPAVHAAVDNELQVWFNGQQVLHKTDTGSDWTTYTITNLLATGASTELLFVNYNEEDYNFLDKVSVTAVPEPAAFGMLLAGLGLLAGVRRRQA